MWEYLILVATIEVDLGDALDIHPGEKHEVGQRLARVMRAAVYREPIAPSGPAIAAASANADGGVTLRFTGVTGGLHARSAARAIGFELCGGSAGSCRYAMGTVTGSEVTLPGDGRPVTRVRERVNPAGAEARRGQTASGVSWRHASEAYGNREIAGGRLSLR